MKTLPKQSRIVTWKHVSYDLGVIQNKWRLSVNHSNPFAAHSEIVLYRDDGQIGKSIYLWELHSPRTKVSILQQNGFRLESRAMSIRLHEGGKHRIDRFQFNVHGGNEELRNWGTIVIKVDEKEWKTTIPSSLYKYVHGVADPHH